MSYDRTLNVRYEENYHGGSFMVKISSVARWNADVWGELHSFLIYRSKK
jgi:hypothetical protein